MSTAVLLVLLVGAQVGLATAEVGCEWIPDLSRCSAISNLADDSPASALIADSGVCLANTASGLQGCEEDLPQCQAVTVSGLPVGVCIPALAVAGTLSLSEAESLFRIEDCAGISTPECDAVRASYYGLLGCMECIEEANTAAALEAVCAEALTEPDCDVASAASHGPEAVPDADSDADDRDIDVDVDITIPPVVSADSPLPGDTYFPYDPYYFDYPTPPVVTSEADAPEPFFDDGDEFTYPVTYDPYDSFAYAPLGGGEPPGAVVDYYTGFVPYDAEAYEPEPFGPYLTDEPAYYDAAPPYSYYFYYGDYPAPPDGALEPLASPVDAIPPLDLGDIDVSVAVEGDEEEESDAPEDDVTPGDIRAFIDPVLADAEDADSPVTVLLEPFAAAAPHSLFFSAISVAALLAGALCMLL
eukprot:jgi/Ulvmu1/6906/UM031_0113.1